MVDKTITRRQLQELEKDGALVAIEQKPMQIEQLDELIGAVKSMVSNEEERIRADLARNQTQLEVLATLQGLIKKDTGGVNRSPPAADMQALRVVVEELKESLNREPADYDFKIIRNGPGLSPAHTIEARVVRPTLN